MRLIPLKHYIPLPDLLPENEGRLEESYPGRSAKKFRDLACINGVVKFIEMEHHVVTTQKPSHPLISGKVYDSDVIMSRERKEPEPPSYNGWKASMWSRALPSNCWEMGPVFDAADIILDNSLDLSLLSGVMGAVDIDKIVFKDLYSAYPTLSTDGDDILYLALMGEPNNLDGRMAVIDLGTKRVKDLGEYSLEMHSPLVKTFGPSTVPVVTTGKVPASACVHTNQANNSERDPNNTSVCAGHASSCGSDNKRPRLLAEKVDHGQYGAQNVVQNDISLAPQQHFINHYTPLYPHQFQAPYTPLYAHQNNQRYFNWWDGSHNPGYALSAPPPELSEYFNCQPLWQHSQPLEHQETRTSVFGPPDS